MTDASLKVGLEIHIYPRMESAAKLFCDCRIDPEAAPNTNICPVCTSQPGANPMAPNEEAIVKTVAIAKLFGSTLDPKPAFQRKHYSWPDLPSGYQRTMSGSYAYPIARGGAFRDIGIIQVHLEEDPARWDPESGGVDYNRCGTPLVEVVTEPDFTSPEQVREWLEHFRRRLDYAGCFDERFGVKADVNVSIGPKFDRVEVKNINSFTAIYDSIIFEYERQSALAGTGKVPQETRTWTGSETVFMRSKENAVDYRFIPEQDLPRVNLVDAIYDQADSLIERDPEVAYATMVDAGMNEEDAAVLVEIPIVSAHAEAMLDAGLQGAFVGRFLRREFLRVVNYHQAHPRTFSASSEHLVELAQLAHDKTVSDKTVKDLMEALYGDDFSPKEKVESEGLGMVSDDSALREAAQSVIEANPQAAADYQSGNANAINFLAGQIMREMKGKADIKKAREILEELL